MIFLRQVLHMWGASFCLLSKWIYGVVIFSLHVDGKSGEVSSSTKHFWSFTVKQQLETSFKTEKHQMSPCSSSAVITIVTFCQYEGGNDDWIDMFWVNCSFKCCKAHYKPPLINTFSKQGNRLVKLRNYLRCLLTGADCRYWSSGSVRNTVTELTAPPNGPEEPWAAGLWARVEIRTLD